MHKNISAPVQEFCFCTAAFGKVYRSLSKLLAQDLLDLAPDIELIIFTDKPEDFTDYPNVETVKHYQRGIEPHHERRFAIQYALSKVKSVMYMDCDVRILDVDLEGLAFQPGLTARSCGPLSKHMKEQFGRPNLSLQRQKKKLIIEQMAASVGISLEEPNLKFINEFLFVVTADEGKELDFLRTWGELAICADTLGMYRHPTFAMALAAQKSNFSVYRSDMEWLDFFDDRVEKYAISHGKSTAGAKAKYFEAQYSIEYPQKNIFQKATGKISKTLSFLYHLGRSKLTYTFRRESLY